VECKCAKILIVDDEPTNILALTLMLSKFALKADSSLNGKECLIKLE
jgi:CheY-like chemotaxis protein